MLNKVQVIGHLGNDPEVRYTASGAAITNISVASTEKWKDKQGAEQSETEWFRITFFGRLAEIAGQYLKKGSLVYVDGKLKTTKYTDKNGIERYSTDVIAREMKMLGGGQGSSNNQGGFKPQNNNGAPQGNSQPSGGFDDFDSTVPF
ncbi:single-stranded DNA-binding protein [Pseudomonas sp.]|uniref:single-stranded DNA-binding protein n=1 Tax=Pseudomonas sp. TaxID=306 RepID=UPI0026090B3F|nr:single-stranded DNA-binding protein [Pseudomonas sp.]